MRRLVLSVYEYYFCFVFILFSVFTGINTEDYHLKSLNVQTDISIFINLRYLQLKLLKNKENNKKICDSFHHVKIKSFIFAFDDGLT